MRRRLGSGGFATVWLAHDEQLDAEVAIKVLADNWGHDDTVRRRFLEEGRFLRRVESEHVVQVHDVGELEDGRPFLVLTYADRGTLADRLKKEPLALPDAVDVVVQVGRGLQALHRRGLLHRDVKPANVLFRSTDEGERAVLSDLGLGKSLDEVSRITMPGGTPSYVAPEQAMGERLDQRADQYSLGAVAYAALTGRSPHQVDGLGAASRVTAAPPPSTLGFDLPDKIDSAIVRALDPDREKRWPDVQSFTRELVGALDETTHNFVPSTVSARETVVVSASTSTSTSDVGENTALSDANKPTIVKTPAPAETVDAPTEPPAAAESVAPPKRRRGRWVVAAVLALIVGGGAGFVGQRYLADRESITVSQGGFSVDLPRGWAKSVAQSDWQPPGGSGSYPALRVSRDADWSSTGTPGIFVGLADAKLTLPDSAQFGCSQDEDQPNGNLDGQNTTGRVSSGCGDAGMVLLQRVVERGDARSLLVQVMVPQSDLVRAVEMADSVKYSG
ncbi:serine/threonine protein kinase [Kribbella steppae]|uniref:non-specific serine/threonine protein kinase n=1 Tax=Kribbella steppae TaxID=2512223 RepID=A0A4R2HKH4_9ACTN|nr:serine/threonine-protein kinase [Kribbella steppae]TCO30529.1 serine/threonine protein kinase [Kribbella steppae]